ncbi:hypothetical protein DEO72_LG5g1274 [Vigna unguiculata]|uniref:Uncharacterized protein n=1 Tax=Vigna unguiculata TaxID=3917 RepID=A0A4D6LWF0_VIGUN|nr:hypothetical protein DEO72_LG5g1274 [Vigna unguiculata]
MCLFVATLSLYVNDTGRWLRSSKFEGAAVEELWFVPMPHSCFGVSCWWQMTRVLLFMVQRWFRRDLDRYCIEDGGNAVISRDLGFERW